MKLRWKIFIVINIVVLGAFAVSLAMELLQIILFFSVYHVPLWGLLVTAAFTAVIYFNCIRNIELCKVILYNKKDVKVKPAVTRNLTALFGIAVFFLGYGLIRSYDTFKISFYNKNVLNIIAYTFQVITVFAGTYIVFQQGTLGKSASVISEEEINNSIDEIGS